MPLSYKIEVNIGKIEIDEERYFSFKWKAAVAGSKKKYKGNYNSSFEGHTGKEMLKILENGYALALVLEQMGQE